VPVEVPPEALPRGAGECVLVVDDEAPILNVVRQTLESAFASRARYSLIPAKNL